MAWLRAHWRTDYLPAVDDWGDYLVRSEAALLVPMISWLKFKIGVSETYDSTPAEDSDKNTFATSRSAWRRCTEQFLAIRTYPGVGRGTGVP